jgi:hypothetical protein
MLEEILSIGLAAIIALALLVALVNSLNLLVQ